MLEHSVVEGSSIADILIVDVGREQFDLFRERNKCSDKKKDEADYQGNYRIDGDMEEEKLYE